VHSAKDLPAELAPGCLIAAYPEREDPRDVFIGRKGLAWKDLAAPLRVGTSSLRRRYQLLEAKPGLELIAMRGNVDTRIKKIEEGVCDGVILAAAGLNRLGRTDVVRDAVPADVIVPAPAQGALAAEVRGDRADLKELVGRLDHRATRQCVEFEREFLKAVGGGCSTPLGAYATLTGGALDISIFWSREDGSGARRLHGRCADPAESGKEASRLAAQLAGA